MKIIPIREDLVSITDNYVQAIILNYFIEEYEKSKQEWISRKAKDLSTELLLNVSGMTIQRRLIELLDKKYLETRNNPEDKFDKTHEYKVNMDKINKDLKNKGY